MPIPTLPPKNPKFWEFISIPVALVNLPPSCTSNPDRVKPFEAVVDSKVPLVGQAVLQSDPKQMEPVEERDPTERYEVMEADLPIPTLPVRLDNPVTFNPPFKTDSPVVVRDDPIPTFPVILASPQTSSLLLDVVAPIPTLPSTKRPLAGAAIPW